MDKSELIFFRVLSDIKRYLNNLTLVGGWVPYVYGKYLWRDVQVMPLATSDIDFGIGAHVGGTPAQTIYEALSAKYGEHHISMDRLYPIVFHLENVEIHFLSSEGMNEQSIEKLVGKQVDVSRVQHFDVLLNNRIAIDILDNKANKYAIHIPKPCAYIYHKGLTFVSRQYEAAMAKDLHYMYYVLRFCPNLDEVLLELKQFKGDRNSAKFVENMNRYFERISGRGCLLVEKENGPDYYVMSVREDAFDRFQNLIRYFD